MHLNQLRLITFDINNTLLKTKLKTGLLYSLVGELYGIQCNSRRLECILNKEYNVLLDHYPVFGFETIGYEKWWRQVIRNTFYNYNNKIPLEKVDSIADLLIEWFSTNLFWEECRDCRTMLNFLHGRKSLGVISNSDPRSHRLLKDFDIISYFKFVLTSFDVGVLKPDTKIFERAMRSSNVQNLRPEECLHIGDCVESDYMGARNFGWNAFLVDKRKLEDIREEYGTVEPQHVFSDLSAILEKFKKDMDPVRRF